MEENFHSAYHGSMNMHAVGIYIGELRERRGFSQVALASRVGVSDRQLRSYEKGEHEPKISVMTALLEVLRGAWEDVIVLLQDEATEDQARSLAEDRILNDEDRATFASLTPDQRQLIAGMIREFRRQSQSHR